MAQKQVHLTEGLCLWEEGCLQKTGQTATTTIDQQNVSDISIELLPSELLSFQAGKVTGNYDSWVILTKDKFILNIIHDGLKMVFFEEPCPLQT